MSRYSRNYRTQEAPDNHDRWMVSYADFITLLFAFFVVMYAISVSKEGEFTVVSESIQEAFNSGSSQKDENSEEVSQEANNVIDLQGGSGLLPENNSLTEPVVELSESMEHLQNLANQAVMQPVVDEVEKTLQSLLESGGVNITSDDLWMKIDIESEVLFESGFAALHQKATPTMHALANVLKKFPHSVQVEGYTDNIPIQNETYPSNWELSAARAASVVHLFTQSGVDPRRMSAIGYGEFRPLGSNNTAQGRSKNRRVSIIVLADSQVGRLVDIQQQFKQSADLKP